MRYTLTALMLAGVLATSGIAFAQTSTSKPASTSASKPAKPATPATHSVKGVVKSVDTSALVITPSGKKDMTFKLDTTTQREGSITTGTPVSVRYHMDGSSMVATAVTAEAPKASKTAKK